MPSTSSHVDAARSSRGYLFSVVALAVLLTALAAIQWIRDGRAADPLRARDSQPSADASLSEESQRTEMAERSRLEANDRLHDAQSTLASLRDQQEATIVELDRLNRTAKSLDRQIQTEEAVARAERSRPSRRTEREARRDTPSVRAEDEQRQALEASMADLKTQRLQLLTRFTSRHPIVQDIDQRIAEVASALEAARPEPLISSQSPGENTPHAADERDQERLLAAEQKLHELRRELDELNAARDEQTLRLSALQDEIASQTQVAEGARAALARLETVTDQVVDAAPAAVGEDRPAEHVGAFGLVFSLAMGCAVGCVAYLKAKPVNQRISSRSEIESILAMPLIGLLPGMSDTPDLEPVPEPGLPRKIRSAAEVAVGVFALSAAAAAALVEGHSDRLVRQPLSTLADSVRVLATHLLG